MIEFVYLIVCVVFGLSMLVLSVYYFTQGVYAIVGMVFAMIGVIFLVISGAKLRARKLGHKHATDDPRIAKVQLIALAGAFVLSPILYAILYWLFGVSNLFALGCAFVIFLTLYSISEYLDEA